MNSLKDRPRDINLNFAIDESEEERPFYVLQKYGLDFENTSRDRLVEQGFEAPECAVRVTTLTKFCSHTSGSLTL